MDLFPYVLKSGRSADTPKFPVSALSIRHSSVSTSCFQSSPIRKKYGLPHPYTPSHRTACCHTPHLLPHLNSLSASQKRCQLLLRFFRQTKFCQHRIPFSFRFRNKRILFLCPDFFPRFHPHRIRFDQPPRPGKSCESAFQIQVYQRPSANQHPLRFWKPYGEPDRKSKTPRDNKDGIKYFSLRAIRWYSSSVMIPSMLCL